MDGGLEVGEAVSEVGVPSQISSSQPVFVANLHVLESERFRMSQLCAASTPSRIRGTTNELDLLKSIINKLLQLVLGRDIAVERETGVDGED